MSRNINVALIYDFDGTLSPGNMQEFGFIQAIGKDITQFWEQSNGLAHDNDASQILCYMYMMLKFAKANNISLKRESFKKFGANIELFPGVYEWFELVNNYAKDRHITLTHFINSSGLKEMIEGTPIAKEFENIYACSYLYDVDGVAYWPAVAVDYTAKTQFLFKINKGIKEVSDTIQINKYTPEEDRPMPFSHMIYFGDGTTDIPSMKLVKEHGGHSIAVYGDSSKKKMALMLIKENRANFVCKADYTEKGEIYSVVKRILDKIKSDNEFSRLLNIHRKRCE
jgi:hypothetical protein